jgi:hypothetical protein
LLIVVGTAAFGIIIRSAERAVVIIKIEVKIMNL